MNPHRTSAASGPSTATCRSRTTCARSWAASTAPSHHGCRATAWLRAEPAGAVPVGDDASLDVEGARAAGMRVVQVTDASLKALGARRPDAVVSSLAALPAAIVRLDPVP